MRPSRTKGSIAGGTLDTGSSLTGLRPAAGYDLARRCDCGASAVEVEVARGALLEPEPVVLRRLLEEVGRLLEQVLTVGLVVGRDDVGLVRGRLRVGRGRLRGRRGRRVVARGWRVVRGGRLLGF